MPNRMDRNPFKSNQSKSPRQRGIKNAGFIALIILLLLVVVAAYNKPSSLQTVPLSQVIQNANAGDYKSIQVNGQQLQITPKGSSKATEQSYIGTYTDLKTEGLNLSKVQLQYKPQSNTASDLANIGITVLPVLGISLLLFFMLRSAQGQGNQAISFGKSRARLYGNEKDKINFASVAGSVKPSKIFKKLLNF